MPTPVDAQLLLGSHGWPSAPLRGGTGKRAASSIRAQRGRSDRCQTEEVPQRPTRHHRPRPTRRQRPRPTGQHHPHPTRHHRPRPTRQHNLRPKGHHARCRSARHRATRAGGPQRDTLLPRRAAMGDKARHGSLTRSAPQWKVRQDQGRTTSSAGVVRIWNLGRNGIRIHADPSYLITDNSIS